MGAANISPPMPLIGSCLFLSMTAHRDLASRMHVRNGAESGQIRTDANDPSETCAALDFRSAHWALSPVSLLAIFCFDMEVECRTA